MFDQLMKQNEAMLKSMQSMMGLEAMQNAMKPMVDLLEMQRTMFETLAEENMRLANELMADCLDEARLACQCESMPEMMEVQKKFAVKYQEKMAELVKSQAASLTQVSEQALKVMTENAQAVIPNIQKS